MATSWSSIDGLGRQTWRRDKDGGLLVFCRLVGASNIAEDKMAASWSTVGGSGSSVLGWGPPRVGGRP